MLAASSGDAIMACLLSSDGKVSDPALIGSLDPKQQLAFDLVNRQGETDATELMRDFGEEGQRANVWNNRLASLAALGVIIEVSQGRSKRYRPVLVGA